MSDQTVRVVVGEGGEPSRGALRFVLDGEGFDVVGEGSSPAELEEVLREAEPAVVVLGADISAKAVLMVREQAPFAKVIVVWPAGVSAGIADERVEPSRIYDELGVAVRRQADRRFVSIPEAADPIDRIVRIPDAEVAAGFEAEDDAAFKRELETEFEFEAEPGLVATGRANPGRRSARALVGVASPISLVILMIGAAFALEGSRPSTHPTGVRRSEASPSVGSRTDGSNRDVGTSLSGSKCRPGGRAQDRSRTPHANRGDRGNRGAGCEAEGQGSARGQGQGRAPGHPKPGPSRNKSNNGNHRQAGGDHSGSSASSDGHGNADEHASAAGHAHASAAPGHPK